MIFPMTSLTNASVRPIGVLPEIWFVKPPEVDTGCLWDPTTEEHDSIQEAFKRVSSFITPEYAVEHGDIFEQYYKDIKFIFKSGGE